MKTEQTMPLLVIEAEGKIVTSNFAEFDQAARQWLSEINLNLRTDDDFDQAAADVKKAKEVEELMEATREAVLEKAETLNAELTKLATLSAAMREARLNLTKQIDKAKADQRKQVVDAELTKLECDKSMREVYRPAIDAAIKGRKGLAGMREAASIARTVANDQIRKAKRMLDEFDAEHGETLLPDRRNLDVTPPDVLAAELRRRIEAAAAQAKAKRLQEELAAEKEKARVASEADRQAVAHEKAQEIYESSVKAATGHDCWGEEYEPSEAEEWEMMKQAVVGAFMTLRTARGRLKHPRNIKRAEEFSKSVNIAWGEANQ